MFSIIVLVIVFLLIAIRQIGNVRLQIWQIMLFGALAVLITGQVSPAAAVKAINLDVMLFLFGMFIIGEALEESGVLSYISQRLFSRAKSLDMLVLSVLFTMGLLSALLMNDTIAIIGTPVVLLLANKTGVRPKLLLLALSFAVTIGSVMSPIGNPQNLLIALNGEVANPFGTFLKFLLLPTLINLFLAYLLIRLFYKENFRASRSLSYLQEPVKNRRLAFISAISMAILVLLILAKIITVLLDLPVDFKLTYIALASAAPIVLLSSRRAAIIRSIDWSTLLFFAAMFILMESVWETGVFQAGIESLPLDLRSTSMVLAVSVILSQLISNVPLVALYLPMLLQWGGQTREMMALAAGSTIAGNFSILGAASNVIIIQNAEKKSGDTLTFLEFARIGIPLTAVNVIIYWLFLS